WTLCWPGTNSLRFRLRYGESSTALYGLSAIVFPACSFKAGLGSNDSMWLMPPTRKIQMTFLALDLGCGAATSSAAFRTPSFASIAPRATPANPMPMSVKKVRREGLTQRHEGTEGRVEDIKESLFISNTPDSSSFDSLAF